MFVFNGRKPYVAITRNIKQGELDKMITIQLNDENISTTDMVFSQDRRLKTIFSELPKEELKKLLCYIVDNYYQPYK